MAAQSMESSTIEGSTFSQSSMKNHNAINALGFLGSDSSLELSTPLSYVLPHVDEPYLV